MLVCSGSMIDMSVAVMGRTELPHKFKNQRITCVKIPAWPVRFSSVYKRDTPDITCFCRDTIWVMLQYSSIQLSASHGWTSWSWLLTFTVLESHQQQSATVGNNCMMAWIRVMDTWLWHQDGARAAHAEWVLLSILRILKQWYLVSAKFTDQMDLSHRTWVAVVGLYIALGRSILKYFEMKYSFALASVQVLKVIDSSGERNDCLILLQVFPAILDEFGSSLNNTAEMSCMKSIETYANALSPTSSATHAPLTSWFYWAYQPTSGGTGGIVGDDWRSVMW